MASQKGVTFLDTCSYTITIKCSYVRVNNKHSDIYATIGIQQKK